MTQSDPLDTSIGAARLQLFATRAAVSRAVTLQGDQVILDPLAGPIPDEAAISVLAHLPKPVVCSARLIDDVVALDCPSMNTLSAAEQNALQMLQDPDQSKRSFLYFVRDRHQGNVDALPVVCTGRSHLVVTVGEAERWYRDYRFALWPSGKLPLEPNYGVRDVERVSASDGSAVVDARAEGAVALISFSSPFDERHPNVGLFQFATPDENDASEKQTQIPAGMDSMLVDVATRFGQHPIPVDSLPSEARQVLAQFAATMRRVWKDRDMLPAVAAFVKRFGPQ